MLDFIPVDPPDPNATTVFTGDEIPKEMDLFYRTEENFLPKGKRFEDLTAKEKAYLKAQYTYDPIRSGCYQSVTGFGGIP